MAGGGIQQSTKKEDTGNSDAIVATVATAIAIAIFATDAVAVE
jgi:hypothetical protein